MAEVARSRTDSNCEVSELGLRPFTQRLLEADPKDVRAHWTIIGSDVRYCSNSLTEQSWKALFEFGDFDPRWLVEYHYWVQITSGVNTPPLLADLLRRHGLVEAVEPALRALRNDDERWVNRVVACLVSVLPAGRRDRRPDR